MTPEDHKRGIIRAIHRAGGVTNLPDAPDGPLVEVFNPREVARAIRNEVVRSKLNGWPKISLHMDLEDALAIAQALDR